MKSFKVDDVELEVGHDPGQNETSFAARDATGRVVLDFRCSYTEGSCRVGAAGGAREVSAPASEDPLEWILRMASGAARELLPVYPSREALAPIRADIERALRNPPFDFESVTPERRLPSHGEKWTTYPEDVLPLWVADMDLPVAEPVRRLLARAVLRSDIGYPIHPAPTELPELTVARMEERFGWSPDAKCVEILTDVVQGMYVAVHQFTEPGDGIVVQTPIYPPFLNAASYEGRRRIEAPLVEEGLHYRVDLDALAAAIDDGTRVILLCNPHNPTGRVFTRDELEGIARLAIERDLVVVSDEIHSDLIYSGQRHIPIASLSAEIEARTITLTAASKAFNMAGLRCAVAILGSDEVARRFRKLARHIRGGVSVPGIEAIQQAWRHGAPWLEHAVAHLEANRDLVVETVRAELPGIGVVPPESTYLAWLDCRGLDLKPTPYEFFLERARVALSPGRAFGPPGAGFARINFATSRGILTEALERMSKALRT
jgi:cystathionine beta-lyase